MKYCKWNKYIKDEEIKLNESKKRLQQDILYINNLMKIRLQCNKTGKPDIRDMVVYENEKRWLSGNELIDTKKKHDKFVGKKHNIETTNWIKYCLGNKLFAEIKKEYYYNKKSFLEACAKLKITTCKEYEEKYREDKRLASPEYIDNGFYHDMDPVFNLQLLLNTDEEDEEDI